ncbi:class II aldolase/adducin family protein [Rhodococcus opacus]|uniref:class II aldolase/adducin family protein n=1 Tax=Rhodococcus opacus TaxID=37919 RepID=UPI002235BDEC|nr:class II aldolase/adducin family protein [Rhodococcus opacus]UZG59557.1 class II aldolase/adducin family protein [Rhodococcus opacus]
MRDEQLVAQVVDAHLALAEAGQGDLIWGHVAVRDPAGRGIWIKAAGWGMDEIGPDQVQLVSFDGDVLLGQGPRHIEYHIHTELMRQRADVGASVHSHASSATAFASLNVPLRALSHDATPFLDPDVSRFHETGNLIATTELGRALADCVGSGNGCLIPAHGLVTVGATVSDAVMHAVLLDRACATHLTALAAGGPRRWSSEEEVAAKRSTLWPPRAFSSAFDYLVRRADRTTASKATSQVNVKG